MIKLELTEIEIVQLCNTIETEIRVAYGKKYEHVISADIKLLNKINKIYLDYLNKKEA